MRYRPLALPNARAAAASKISWQRLRVQLGGCVLFASVLPYAVRSLTAPELSPPGQLEQTFLGGLVATLLGVWFLRSLSNFPGIRAASYVLPTFSISFAAVLLVFFLGRLDYNRGLLLFAFLGSCAWFLFVTVRASRQQSLRVGVVPFGAVDMLSGIGSIAQTRLSQPASTPGRFDAIVADLRADLPEDWDRCLADFALLGVPVFHVKTLYESITGRVEIEHLSENSFGSLIPNSAYFAVKATFDWLAAVVALLLLSPILALIAIAIRLDSPGPVIFRQERVGYRGLVFTMYKFRTMVTDPVGTDGHLEAAKTQSGDPRVTSVGRFLRKYRIDELPQIINILKGDMSWIGPRPEAQVLSAWYEQQIAFYRYRHIVRPGITGWAQVNQGHVAEVDDVRNKLYYDFYYIKNFSPWIDVLIAARTLNTMLTGDGAK